MQVNPTTKIQVKLHDRKTYDGKEKYKALPPEIRQKFLECLNEHKFLKPLCLCMMLSGLCTGETLVLMWKDIGFERKTINVERAITIVPKFNENGKIIERKTVISETKTACSKRVVPMPELLIEVLKNYKIEQELKADEQNKRLTDKSSLVFGNDDGSLRTYSGTKKIFYHFLEKHGLDGYNIHFHTLRHTYSNMLFEADQNPKVIQQLLGHRDVKTTITVYNSVDNKYVRQTTEKFNDKLKQDKLFEDEQNRKRRVEDKKQELLSKMSDDKFDELLKKLMQKRKQKERKQKDFEM